MLPAMAPSCFKTTSINVRKPCLRAVLLCALAFAGLNGCAITPQPVFGATLPNYRVAPGVAWGTTYGPSRARIIDANGVAHIVRGNGESIAGGSPVTVGVIVPVYATVRAALVPRLEANAHLGLYGGGVGLRARLNAEGAPAEVFVSVGGQIGYAVPHDDRTQQLGIPYAGRVLLETAVAISPQGQMFGAVGHTLYGGSSRRALTCSSRKSRNAATLRGTCPLDG
jgi:hypothetical protein